MVQEQAQAFLKNLPHEEQQKRQIAIRYVLTHLRWRWLLALGIAMGVLNGAYYRTVLLNPVIGIFLCILIWFTNRPLVWWYDLFYFEFCSHSPALPGSSVLQLAPSCNSPSAATPDAKLWVTSTILPEWQCLS